MLRTPFFYSLFTVLLLSTGSEIVAQATQKPVQAPTAKFKPPVVKTVLGNNISGISPVVTVEEGKEIIASPLRIVDEKNNNYTISSYQFSFKRVGVSEDSTGKIIPQTDMVADRFTATPLPEIWRNTIKETLEKGEELYFFDIIVMDKEGRRFFAPELKILVQ